MSEIKVHIDFIPQAAYCKLIGKGERYVYGKIHDGKWTEGKEYIKDPDGQIWVSIKGVESWITQGASGHTVMESKSRSHGSVVDIDQRGRKSQTSETLKRRPVYELR